ncbi:MAG: leucyl/phenylalanyl-tRNA--protein transferase [Desulfonatronovibrionaceae bacterium]
MSVFYLSEKPDFPHPALADPDGLLAVGGDLHPDRLIKAYSQGIFPWYGPGSPILWWSPDPRLVLFPEELHIPKRLSRVLRSGRFLVTADLAFEQVIDNCARAVRPEGQGTWLVPEMIDAYIRLHEAGLAHSFETWQGSRLVGGIYGVALGGAFFGESMFYLKPEASKAALVHLVHRLDELGFSFMDCQQTTRHMLRFGARELSGREFYIRLKKALKVNIPAGKWHYQG